MRQSHQHLGEILVGHGDLSTDALQQALVEQRASGLMLGELLVKKGIVSGPALVRALAAQLKVQGCTLRHGLVDPALIGMLDVDEAVRLQVVPMFRVRDTLTVAMAEPQSLPILDRLREVTGMRIRPVLALSTNIHEFLESYRGGDASVNAFLASLEDGDVSLVESDTTDQEHVTDIGRIVDGSPIINLVNVALLTAIRDDASDIHIEPSRDGTRIRYRIDGVLRELMNPPRGMHSAIVSRVKVISRIDIAEKRLPQEGRVRIAAEGREVDLRVSTMPTILGEKVVLRVLDQANLSVRLEQLGFRDRQREMFESVLRQPNGMVLVTGPTGSGKTTTLYSALDLLRTPDTNIVTIEDPVEYQLDLMNQIQVHSSVGLTFANALRSILRQDPDIIMIGEIRDHETARVAVQAALTGHLILATLHTNDAPGTIARLLDMDIEPYLLSGAINGIVAQRLARTNCPSCMTKYYPEELVLAGTGRDDLSGRPFRKGTGCDHCHNSGFRGRRGIFEILTVSSSIQKLIHAAAPTHEIRAEHLRAGGTTLLQEGIRAAIEGETSLEEALRVTRVGPDCNVSDSEPSDVEARAAA